MERIKWSKSPYLVSHSSAFALKGDWSDKTLNFWCDRLGLSILFNGLSDDVLGDWIRFVQGKELSDVVSSLWTQSTWDLLVGKTFNFAFALLDNGQVQDWQVVVDNASTDGFSLSFTSATWFVARVTLGKKKSDTTVVEDTYIYLSKTPLQSL